MQFTACYVLLITCAFYMTWASLDINTLTGMQKKILADSSWRLKLEFFKNRSELTPRARTVGIQARVLPVLNIIDSSEEEHSEEKLNDTETWRHMKHKIMKVMYERVKDSDFKAKRAQMVWEKYDEDAAFQFGYLFSNITDRFDLMLQLEAVAMEKYLDWQAFELFNIYVEMYYQYLAIVDIRKRIVPQLQKLEKPGP